MVVGVGVRPSTAVAEKAGIAIDRGIAVNEFLETNVPGIFAAGDVADGPIPTPASASAWNTGSWRSVRARWPRATCWDGVKRFDAVPFFWSQHYDVTIRYVGHAERWDSVTIEGSLDRRDATVRFIRGGATRAVATVSRDRACLEAEVVLEQSTVAARKS